MNVPSAKGPSSGITRFLPRRPIRSRVRGLLRKGWPMLVWLLAGAAAVWLYAIDGARGRVTAIVADDRVAVNTQFAARVRAVLVEPGDSVAAGQVVATLDDADARIRLDLVSAELDRLEADVPAQAQAWRRAAAAARTDAARLRLDLARRDGERKRDDLTSVSAERGFAEGLEAVQDRIIVVSGEIDHDRAVLRETDAELDRLKALGGAAAAAPVSLDVLSARHDATLKRIEANERRLAELGRQRDAACARAKRCSEVAVPCSAAQAEPGPEAASALEAAAADEDVALAPAYAAVRAQEQRLRELRAEIDALSLRAPAAGRVSEVVLTPGEFAPAGASILTLVPSRAGRFVGFVPEGEGLAVAPGERVLLRPSHRRGDAIEGRVVHVGAAVVEAPLRFRPSPTIPIWGREIYLQADSAPSLIPGEAYGVVFTE